MQNVQLKLIVIVIIVIATTIFAIVIVKTILSKCRHSYKQTQLLHTQHLHHQSNKRMQTHTHTVIKQAIRIQYPGTYHLVLISNVGTVMSYSAQCNVLLCISTTDIYFLREGSRS